MCHYLLDQSVVNHAIDEWRRRRLMACVDAEGGHFEQAYL